MLHPSVTLKMIIKHDLFQSNVFVFNVIDVCLYLNVLRLLLSDTSETGVQGEGAPERAEGLGDGRPSKKIRNFLSQNVFITIKITLSSISIREREGHREP